jgi:ABC-2 type transport system ATP-binding protein
MTRIWESSTAQGRTVVVNTHRLEEAERVCDRVGILRTRLLRVGTPHELRTAMTRSRRINIELETVRDRDIDVLACGSASARVPGVRPRTAPAFDQRQVV